MEQGIMKTRQNMDFWTEERTAKLQDLRAQNLSLKQIAAELRISRAAVSGKINRLGLCRERVRKEKPRQTTPQKSTPSVVSDLPTLPNGANIPTAQRRTLLQLTPGVCKWPFGKPSSPDFFFCGGDAVESKPYCPEHCRVAYPAFRG
jgi:GcrA cell cycle regulator